MTRALYEWLLWLHPPAFRRQFAAEMLWIFDEASESEGVVALLLDGLVSLMRQWLLRSGAWKVAAAVAGGLLQVTAGGLGMLLLGHAQLTGFLAAAQLDGGWTENLRSAAPIAMSTLIRLASGSVIGILLMVIGLALWVKNFTERRIRDLQPRRNRGRRCSNCAV